MCCHKTSCQSNVILLKQNKGKYKVYIDIVNKAVKHTHIVKMMFLANYSIAIGNISELNQTFGLYTDDNGSGDVDPGLYENVEITQGQGGGERAGEAKPGIGYLESMDYYEDNLTTTGVVTELVLEPYSMAHLLATSIVLGTLILATIIGNVFVIAAIILERNLHNVANYLIASLAVADLMVASLVMPLAAVNEVSTQWFLGPEICDMWISFDVLCCTSSILHLVAIAMDRYWAVTRVDYIRNRSAKRMLVMISLSWIISVSISIAPFFGWKDNATDPTMTGECLISQDWGYTLFSTIGAFYLPLVFMIIIYIKIWSTAKSRIRKKNFKTLAQGAPKPLLCPPTPENSHAMTTLTQLSSNQSPEHSSNGSAVALNDANRNSKHHLSVSPPNSPLLKDAPLLSKDSNQKSSFLDITKIYSDIKDRHKNHVDSPAKKKEKQKEKLEAKRERKAARTLAIITGSFICCWLPFFIMALVRPFCGDKCHYPFLLVSIIGWLGYFNSLLNPIIYTIFNPDFRHAFQKILFGKYRGRHMPRR